VTDSLPARLLRDFDEQRTIVDIGDLSRRNLHEVGRQPENLRVGLPQPDEARRHEAIHPLAQSVGFDPMMVQFAAVIADHEKSQCVAHLDFPDQLDHPAARLRLREHLPELKIRVVNVVDLMKLQPQGEHPHGLSDTDFDRLFTTDKPVIFAFHAYPWSIHRLTYRRTNHHNIHVRGYKEEGTITTPFDMTVLNDLDRFHLVMDTIDRLPQTGDKGIYLKQQLKDKLIEHRRYIEKNGQDLPEIRNWKWRNRS